MDGYMRKKGGKKVKKRSAEEGEKKILVPGIAGAGVALMTQPIPTLPLSPLNIFIDGVREKERDWE